MLMYSLFILLISTFIENDAFIVNNCHSKNNINPSKLYSTNIELKEKSILKSNDKVILFDGICNFCNTWVDLLLRIDVNKQYVFSPLQGNKGKELLKAIGKDEDDISSVLLIEGSKLNFYEKSDCVLQVIESLGLPAQLATNIAKNLLPITFRDSIYDMVAENRYNFLGKRETCRCSDPNYSDRFI